MYSHVNTNGGVVDCEWYPVLNILLDLCEAVEETKTQGCHHQHIQKTYYIYLNIYENAASLQEDITLTLTQYKEVMAVLNHQLYFLFLSKTTYQRAMETCLGVKGLMLHMNKFSGMRNDK